MISSNDNVALFYTGKWHCFDPFSAFTVEYNKKVWPTLEHAYQAARFTETSVVEAIYNASSPYEAKRIASVEKKNRDLVVDDWKTKKLEVMRELIQLKVKQHPYVREKLLESSNLIIVEDSSTDSFWGKGEHGDGENHLGKLWMEERDRLQKEMFS